MTKSNQPVAFPLFLRNVRTVLCQAARSGSFRLLMALVITLFSILGKHVPMVIVHSHESSHVASVHDPHAAPDDPHDHEEHPGEDNDGNSGDHHHHLAFSDGTTLFSVQQSLSLAFLHEIRLSPASLGDVCPDGPVFELVKPPQVS